jgi:hypothetical protein
MTTTQMNQALIILQQMKKDLESNQLTVEKLNILLENKSISCGLYAEYMKKIGAKDQISDERALDYFRSVSSFSLVKS